MAAPNVCVRTANSTFIALLLIVSLGCGGSSHSSMAAPQTAAVPQFGHVVLWVEENHGYSQIIGSPDMPYLNSLAAKYGLATQYFANTHPSIGNYFLLTAGQLVTNDSGSGFKRRNSARTWPIISCPAFRLFAPICWTMRTTDPRRPTMRGYNSILRSSSRVLRFRMTVC